MRTQEILIQLGNIDSAIEAGNTLLDGDLPEGKARIVKATLHQLRHRRQHLVEKIPNDASVLFWRSVDTE